jgi:hypothetical protein
VKEVEAEKWLVVKVCQRGFSSSIQLPDIAEKQFLTVQETLVISIFKASQKNYMSEAEFCGFRCGSSRFGESSDKLTGEGNG